MNTRCQHNSWRDQCAECDLQRLQSKYEAVCVELEEVSNRTPVVVWQRITSRPTDYSGRCGDVSLFIANRHGDGYRLKCKLQDTGYLCYCVDLDECKQRADKELRKWLKRTGLV